MGKLAVLICMIIILIFTLLAIRSELRDYVIERENAAQELLISRLHIQLNDRGFIDLSLPDGRVVRLIPTAVYEPWEVTYGRANPR